MHAVDFQRRTDLVLRAASEDLDGASAAFILVGGFYFILWGASTSSCGGFYFILRGAPAPRCELHG
jgi:hypothetical protein